MYSGILNPYYVVFIRRFVLKLPVPQLWRLITPFFLTGPKLGIVLDPYFIYTYGSVLETESSRFSQPGDFLVYLLFIAGVVLVSPRSLSRLLSQIPYSFSYVPLLLCRNLEISARPVYSS